MAWGKLLEKQPPCENEALLCPLWANISIEPLWLPHWYHAGIYSPSDLLNKAGNIMELNEICQLYKVKIHFLEYLRVKRCLKTFLAKFTLENLSYERPILPPYLKLLASPNRGSRHFSEILSQQNDNIKLKTKWNTTLNIDIDTDDWQNVYKVCFKTLKRNDFIWFQYRIIHRILGTRALLHKMNISNTAFRGRYRISRKGGRGLSRVWIFHT